MASGNLGAVATSRAELGDVTDDEIVGLGVEQLMDPDFLQTRTVAGAFQPTAHASTAAPRKRDKRGKQPGSSAAPNAKTPAIDHSTWLQSVCVEVRVSFVALGRE